MFIFIFEQSAIALRIIQLLLVEHLWESESNMSENIFIMMTDVQIESPVFNSEKGEVESRTCCSSIEPI